MCVRTSSKSDHVPQIASLVFQRLAEAPKDGAQQSPVRLLYLCTVGRRRIIASMTVALYFYRQAQCRSSIAPGRLAQFRCQALKGEVQSSQWNGLPNVFTFCTQASTASRKEVVGDQMKP